VDIVKESTQLNKKEKNAKAVSKEPIRTMAKDIAALKEGKAGIVEIGAGPKTVPKPIIKEKELAGERKAVPPVNLPTVESIKKPTEREKASVLLTPSAVPLKKTIQGIKRDSEIKPDLGGGGRKLEKERGKIQDEKKLSPITGTAAEKGISKKIIWAGVGTLLLILALGGFFYWWNYIRSVPSSPAASHYECQDNQCVSVEGEGIDKCQIDKDCQPIEPVSPNPLIPVAGTEVIELPADNQEFLPDKLKLAVLKEQATSTFRYILIKLVSQTEIKYADISYLALGLPMKVEQEIATSVSTGENYTLFSYSQPTGNRLGLVIKMATTSDALFNDLRIWEQTLTNDTLKLLLLKDRIPTPSADKFRSNIYRDVAIRYLNFPNPDLSVDYAMMDNKLIIATSRESMFRTIDVLLESSQ
jgi:hypothetical protein